MLEWTEVEVYERVSECRAGRRENELGEFSLNQQAIERGKEQSRFKCLPAGQVPREQFRLERQRIQEEGN
jgi:hypothetical protein